MKKFKIEYLLYVFIFLSPFLDAFSFLYREHFKTASLAWISLLRPMIPSILFIYIFIKDKKIRLKSIFCSFLLLLYALGHLWIFQKVSTGISIGSVSQEAHYVFNYSYMLYLFFVIHYLNKENRLPYLKQTLFYMLCSYLGIIYVSILTNTSYSTYLDGVGYRGWFISGNSLGTVLLLLATLSLPIMYEKYKKSGFLIYLLLCIYLAVLLGTRTGLFGIILVTGFFFAFLFIEKSAFFKTISLRKIVGLCMLFVLFIGSFCFIGASTLKRRQNLQEESNTIIDINTGSKAHTTGDTASFVHMILSGEVEEEYMSASQQKAYLEMYLLANKYAISPTNLRMQQFLYHVSLFKNQKDIGIFVFGNGYVSQYGEMVLEMDAPAFFFNFGILGFCFYFLPFVYFFFVGCKQMIQNKKWNIEVGMYLVGIVIAFCLSCFAGYVFYSSSCVLVFICLLSCLVKESA